MPFVPELAPLTEVGGEDEHRWRLAEELRYARPGEALVVIPDGFETDLASVPQFLTWFVPRYGLYTKAAILHDHLCSNPAWKDRRFEADRVFRSAMAELGVPCVRRWLMWAAVTWATIVGYLAKLLLPSLAALALVTIAVWTLLDRTWWQRLALVIAAELVAAFFLCLAALGHRRALGPLVACYAISIPGLVFVLVSLPLLVILALYLLIFELRRTLRRWARRIRIIATALGSVAQRELRRVVPKIPEPGPVVTGDSPRERRIEQLLAP